MLIFAQKMYISYQEIYNSIRIEKYYNLLIYNNFIPVKVLFPPLKRKNHSYFNL